jgi:transposase
MRKSYDKQFKIAAVKLVLEDEMPVADAAEALSIHYNSLYRWVSEYEEYIHKICLTLCLLNLDISGSL